MAISVTSEAAQLSSASLAVSPAVALTLLAEPVLVEACAPQFLTHLSTRWPLAGLAVPTAVAFAALAEPILVFTGEAQFLALPTSSPAASLAKADAPGSNLESLRGHRKRERK